MKREVRTLLCIKHTNLTDLMYLCHHGSAQTTSWQVQLKSKTSVEILTSANIILNGISITEKSSQLMVDDIKRRQYDFALNARHSTFCFCSTSFLLNFYSHIYSFGLSFSQSACNLKCQCFTYCNCCSMEKILT